MYKSLKRAEEAALNGERQDFDTQQCRQLMADILPSSPQPQSPRIATEDENASKEHNVGGIDSRHASQLNVHEASQAVDEAGDSDYHNIEPPPPPFRELEPADNATLQTKQIRRDSTGGLRLLDTEGEEIRNAEFGEKYRIDMEDLTQMPTCSLSPTQPNSESAYARFDLQRQLRNQSTLTGQSNMEDVSEDEHTQKCEESAAPKRHHSSTVTDSTAFTYRENDTGHVNLDFVTAPENQDMGYNVSQDASFAPRQQEHAHENSFEPRTPAPPVNPFSQKGSVMKGHEMFGATQPSSIGRHIASPTSSRPSPDVYNNSSLQKRMNTSPIGDLENETSPLQSTVRKMLRSTSADPLPPVASLPRAEPTRVTSTRSFDSRRPNRREPRDTYISSKESQERREKAARASFASPGSDTDSDTEAIPRNRHWKRDTEAKIQRQLAQVSSRPGSGSSGVVEVPSTGRRRRSIQEEYLTQSEGLDGRGTPQEDVIIDSQVPVEEAEAMNDAITNTAEPAPSSTVISQVLPCYRSSPDLPSCPASRVQDLYSNFLAEEASSPPNEPRSLPQPSLPLQELSTNRKDLRTPMVSKTTYVPSDSADTTIPNKILETSPLGEGIIRPMGEITSLSFSDNVDDAIIADAPGFTQDVEFDNALQSIKLSQSPIPPSRARDFPSFEHPAGEAESSVSEDPHAPESSISGVADRQISMSASREAQQAGDTAVIVRVPNELKRQAQANAEDDVQAANNQDEEEIDASQKKHASVDAIAEPEEQNNHVRETAHDEDELDEPPKQSEAVFPGASRMVQRPPKVAAEKRSGLRSKEELRGPSKTLRRSSGTTTPKASAQRPSSRVTKSTSAAKTDSARSKRVSDISSVLSTPLSSLASTPVQIGRSSKRKQTTVGQPVEEPTPVPAPKPSTRTSATHLAKGGTPIPATRRPSRQSMLQAKDDRVQALASAPPIRTSKRKSATLDTDGEEVATRSSKRQSITHATREANNDPLIVPTSNLNSARKSTNLFRKMAFAVSYKEHDEKSHVTHLITGQGGRILEEGFEKLFDTTSLSKSRSQGADDDGELVLTATAKSVGFTALIADEHSRKAKYMQALALGLPCISGRWIVTCVTKEEVVDWIPYLLCAGQSSFLGNAIRSRTLTPYPAIDANFLNIFSSREKLLYGKSVLLVTGRGKAEETRKAYVFLTRALGPTRVGQVADHDQARRKLLEDDSWDLLYVDKNESAAEVAVFGSTVPSTSRSKKRKKGPTAAEESPAPKKIRVISDEVVIQSLILGQLLED